MIPTVMDVAKGIWMSYPNEKEKRSSIDLYSPFPMLFISLTISSDRFIFSLFLVMNPSIDVFSGKDPADISGVKTP